MKYSVKRHVPPYIDKNVGQLTIQNRQCQQKAWSRAYSKAFGQEPNHSNGIPTVLPAPKHNGHAVLAAEKSQPLPISIAISHEGASTHSQPSSAGAVVSEFFSESFAVLRRALEYAKNPRLIAKDFKRVWAEVSVKYWLSAAGLLIFNMGIAETSACVGRYAGYFGKAFGGYGVAAGILIGDHATAFVVGQICWFLTTAKALGANTLREKFSAFGKIEPEVLSIWARGFLATVPFDIVQFFSFAKMYSSMGPAAIATVANGVLGAAGAIGILLALTINFDNIEKIAKRLSLPATKSKEPSTP